MDLSFLIPSQVRRSVIDYFVQNPDAQMGIREMARALKTSPQETFRELCNLESWGLLFSSRRGLERAFRLNQKFRLYFPIRDLFQIYKTEQNRVYEVDRVYEMEDMVAEAKKNPVPPKMIPALTSPRKKPRSYSEEKSLKKMGLL
jgi:hypothetical protein